MKQHARFLALVNANQRELLYRCHWSKEDAQKIVPKLTDILSCDDHLLVDEALRALFLIGTPAATAARGVIPHIGSEFRITRQLAVLTLGQIAHKQPSICLKPMIAALEDDDCRSDAIRILAFLKGKAKPALPALIKHSDNPHSKTRADIVKAVAAIDNRDKSALALFSKSKSDRSKLVRQAAAAALKPTTKGDSSSPRA